MYERFKRGLLKPKEIGLYLKDSWRRVWIYFFLLSAILMIPVFILESTYSGLSSQELNIINENFVTAIAGDYKIEDSKLIFPEDYNQRKYLNLGYYTLNIKNGPISYENMITLYFQEEGIQILFFNVEGGFKPYDELGLSNFDFSDYSTENKVKFGNAINVFVKDYNFETKVIYLIFVFVATIFDLILMITVASFFGPFGVPFKLKFKVGVYASTVYVIMVLFANLFNIEYLIYLGMILMIIYIKKVFTMIIMR